MKFGKHFKRQKVPEWVEAYMDYNGLKRILRGIVFFKQSKQPATPLRTFQRRSSLYRSFSGLTVPSGIPPSERDIEDQVIAVNSSQGEGSMQCYKTDFLEQSKEGGDIEAMFFRKLDEELNKVNTFYKDKVEELMNEASSLDRQMDALVALRIKVENPDANGSSLKTYSTNTAATELSPSDDLNGDGSSGMCRQEVNGCRHDPLEVLEHVKIHNPLESPISTLKGVFRYSEDVELRFKKEELRKVEERLRLVFIEFYQKLRLLKLFSFMNLSAFSKILKKYEKITSRRAARSYMEIVDNSYLGSSDEVSSLLERVEVTFVEHFSDSNRREGMKSLRPKLKKERHKVTFFSGFFSGCSAALVVAVVLRIETKKLMDREEGARYLENIFPIYRRYRINYPFIFGFKQGTELGYREVFLVSTGLAVLALGSFLVNLYLDLGSKTRNFRTFTELVPLSLVSAVLIIIFCPFNIIYSSSRFFFIRCIFHCICAPLYKVTLPDFFLADHLTSQVQALKSLELYICYYRLAEYSQRRNRCHSHGVYNVFYFIVASIPYWMRFLQCLRRLCEEGDAVHGFNGLKYLPTIVAVLVRTACELKKGHAWLVLAFISSAIATIMNTYWDIVVDWGLLRRHSRNFYLRDKLLISHKSVYFAAMVLNVVLRLAWMQLVLEFNLCSLHKMAVTTIVSCLEILRRGIWSFFRLENEHLNNVGKYRAFKSVPRPFSFYDEGNDDSNSDKDD
ncbi:phosphate transporter PHO1 homolog 10-like isoform X2 [Rhodamnia argentea]|uniref:Phosphate transporter PHO1 homolog 10-like isoform X2 n=1 Tax=Rhodamnia argentea TaxID=178133 RepID=A0ABM3HHD5_9MYRT|nr:phosphate transporter PHO1 homolog 10-like isoform X2 [Rhodamnia argentea]